MSDIEDRRLFIITLVIDDPQQPSNGQTPAPPLNIPAFVTDWQAAAEKAKDYIAAFPATPEARNHPNAKLRLQAIQLGGTILV